MQEERGEGIGSNRAIGNRDMAQCIMRKFNIQRNFYCTLHCSECIHSIILSFEVYHSISNSNLRVVCIQPILSFPFLYSNLAPFSLIRYFLSSSLLAILILIIMSSLLFDVALLFFLFFLATT